MKLFSLDLPRLAVAGAAPNKEMVDFPFAPVHPVPPNLPIACEDHIAPIPQKPEATFIKRAVLMAHRSFRNAFKLRLALAFAVPPTIYAAASSFSMMAGHFDNEILSSGAIVNSFGFVVAVAILAIVSMTMSTQVDQRFQLIRRQFDFATEAINVDDDVHIQNAVITLHKSFMYRVVLLRWLQDIRDVVVLAAVVGALIALLAVPYLSNTVPMADWSAWASVFAFDFIVLLLVANRQVQIAGSLILASPIAPTSARLNSLLDEVKNLRRGIRG
jgi:hydrogenase/urease accessory protein HupE